jgi:predicted PurR-regulated permease PerM
LNCFSLCGGVIIKRTGDQMALHPAAFDARPLSNELSTVGSLTDGESPRVIARPWVPLYVIATLLLGAALWCAQDVLIPLVLALLASCGLEPFHRRLMGLGLQRSLAAALLLLCLVGAIAGTAYAMRGQVAVFVNRLPTLTQRVRDQLRDGHGALGSTVQPVQQAANELKKAAEEAAPPPKGVTRVQVEQPAVRATDLLWMGTRGLMTFAAKATMVLFLVFYLLSSGDRYKQKLLSVGPFADRHVTVAVVNKIMEQIEKFLIARVAISAMVAAATGTAIGLLGMSQPVIWGIVAGVLNNIPFVGPLGATAAIALASLVQFGTLEMAASVGGAVAFVALIEGFLITPWIMGRAGRMNTGVVFVSLMFWGWIWNVWGMLLAIPIMMALKAIGDHVPQLRAVSDVLGE